MWRNGVKVKVKSPAKSTSRSATKKRRTRTTSLSLAKAKAWSAFSLYIRTRDAIRTTGGIEDCTCCTCGAIKKRRGTAGDGIQAGHWPAINNRSNAVLFVEQGIHGQCYQCNVLKYGNPPAYDKFMLDTYGTEVMEKLRPLRWETVKYTIAQFNEIEDSYKARTEALLASV